VRLAFDRLSSARTFDVDGRMRVRLAVLSQSNVSRYFGREIIDGRGLGLDPEAEYLMYRPPNELAKAAPSACGLPVLSDHDRSTPFNFGPICSLARR
jgi:uncharacterized protein